MSFFECAPDDNNEPAARSPLGLLFKVMRTALEFVAALGPNSTQTRIDEWDCRTGGSWRYVSIHEGEEYGFHGSFHEVRPDELIVRCVLASFSPLRNFFISSKSVVLAASAASSSALLASSASLCFSNVSRTSSSARSRAT